MKPINSTENFKKDLQRGRKIEEKILDICRQKYPCSVLIDGKFKDYDLFIPETNKKLEIKGVLLPEITLHIGLGTFSPVDVEDLSKHKMDSEELIIEQESADIINNALKNNKKICAVGTTVMRGLESSVSSFGTLNPYNGWTHKFIYPPFDFSIANSMISNFHTPKSTLLMMVSAFGDKDFILKAYKEAMKKKYKFSSYGDAMMII